LLFIPGGVREIIVLLAELEGDPFLSVFVIFYYAVDIEGF
jgi:hypothetical protein